MKPVLARAQAAVVLIGGVLLIWLAAPLLVVGGRHPLDNVAARAALLVALAVAAVLGWVIWKHLERRRNARLFEQLRGADPRAGDALAERFASAMQLLKSGVATDSGESSRGWGRRRQVYRLPWYLFIGAPGAGKTTALLNAGLRFPLAERLGAAPVAGIGGTRQCDWWFTDQAVFIDTAGRYTTQDSHTATDSHEWLTFLRLLRRFRPVQPVNGVIVTVSATDLMHDGPDLQSQAEAVDLRLQELRTELGLSFPVYLLVTKVDLLAGFVEFFGDYDSAAREQAWGITFSPPGSKGPSWHEALAERLAEITSRIAALTPQRLQEEPQIARRAAIYSFAAQVQALWPALERFARRALRSAGEAPAQPVRGIYLSSGTQEGNPIDRLLGDVARSFGLTLRPAKRAATGGKAYFLASFLRGMVIAEAPLAGENLARQRTRDRVLLVTAGMAAMLLLGACFAWALSYRRNAAEVASVGDRIERLRANVEPSATRRIDRLLPIYAALEDLAAGRASQARGGARWSFDFGLDQGPRVARSAEQTYLRLLDRTLAPLLAERLTLALRLGQDPAQRYEALRVALMLANPERLQRAEVRRWAAQAFAVPLPGEAGPAPVGPAAGEQSEWLRHLDALLERNAILDATRLDADAVKAARTTLGALPPEELVHRLLLARARERQGAVLGPAELFGPAATLVFATNDAGGAAPTVPEVFTHRAWTGAIEPALDSTIAQLAAEADWVLGTRSPARQQLLGEPSARAELAKKVALRHAQAAMPHWDRLLAGLRLPTPGDAESLPQWVTSLGAPSSPLRGFLSRLATEFPAPGAATPVSAVYDAAMAEHFETLTDYLRARGASAVDRLVVPIAAALREPAGRPARALEGELRAEAAAAPAGLREMWGTLAEALAQQQRRAIGAQLGNVLAEAAKVCRSLTAERFPFAADATRDMPMADFARLFGPGGVLDSLFRSRLAAQVDTRTRPWRMAGEAGNPKAQAAMRSFESADEIRRLFFAGGASTPRLRLRLTPLSMDPELLMFSADFDGQLLRYENGPRRTKDIVWPGPAASQRVVLRTLPPSPAGVGAEVHEGPWALLRVLQRHGWQRAGAVALGQLEVDGRALRVEISADDPSSVGLLGRMARFRCPEAW